MIEDFAGKPEKILGHQDLRRNKSSREIEDLKKRETVKRLGGFLFGVLTAGTVYKTAEYLYNGNNKKDEVSLDSVGVNDGRMVVLEGVDDSTKTVEKPLAVEKREINNTADHFYWAYNDLSKKNEYFPGEIFEKDLIIAQQLQESGYDPNAKSETDAISVMQLMDSSIKDVPRFLQALNREGVIDYDGPNKISEDQRKEIERLVVERSDYSRAIGKLYLMQLWDNKEYKNGYRGYGIGRQHEASGDTRKAQEQILAAYNGGIKGVGNKPKEMWPKQSREYVGRIYEYRDDIRFSREVLGRKEICFKNCEDYALMFLAKKMDDAGLHGKGREENKKKILNVYAEKLQELFLEKKKENEDFEFEHEDIKSFFSQELL